MTSKPSKQDLRWLTLFENVIHGDEEKRKASRMGLPTLQVPPPSLPQATYALHGVALRHVAVQLASLSWFWRMRHEMAELELDQEHTEILAYDTRQEAEKFIIRQEAWDRLCSSLSLKSYGWLADATSEERLSDGEAFEYLLPKGSKASMVTVLMDLTRPPEEIGYLVEEYRRLLRAQYEDLTCSR